MLEAIDAIEVIILINQQTLMAAWVDCEHICLSSYPII